MNADAERLNAITERIIGAAYDVSNQLGCGFLEKVYENALMVALRKAGLNVVAQRRVQVFYENVVVGDYVADIVVEDTVIVEVKAVSALIDLYVAQGLNYLKATGLPLCLLINFGKPKVEIRRLAL